MLLVSFNIANQNQFYKCMTINHIYAIFSLLIYQTENVSVCTNYYTETLKPIEFRFRINLTYITDS